MGGQQGDIGVIETESGSFTVKDTIHLQGGKIGHVGTMTKGMLTQGETVTLKVDEKNRQLTSKNHIATHVLQKALRMVLGSHVEQAGSYVSKDRLRFDFTHFQAMTKEELAKVEQIVNDQIAAALPVITKETTIDEAKKMGAMALFGEKNGSTVRVVCMGDFSLELFAGTHQRQQINCFKIISESGIAAGVRRIEALTSEGLIHYYERLSADLAEASAAAKTTPDKLTERIETRQGEIKALQSENEKLKNQMAKDAVGNVMDQVVEINGVKLLAVALKDTGMNELRNKRCQFKEKLETVL